MKIIDAHMHLPADMLTLKEKKSIILTEMKRNKVSYGFVISDSAIVSNIGSMEECAELFCNCNMIGVIGGISPLIDYDKQLRLLENYIIAGNISGIKIYSGHEPIYPNDFRLTRIYEIALKHSVPVLFHTGWDMPEYSSPIIVKQIADIYKNINFICCHCCYPNLTECFDILSKCKNVYFDISSLAEGKHFDVRKALEDTIHIMPDRFIFGSDLGCCSQSEHIEFAQSLNISKKEKMLLFYENSENIFGINI